MALACVALAGCEFHSHPAGASGPDAAADADGDGVVDSMDNCAAVANADQHDEDGDLVGDLCDRCPQLVETSDDSDADGVPNACDPRPLVPGDTLVRFDPFTSTGNLPAGWQARGGNPSDMPDLWRRDGDALELAVANNQIPIAVVDAGSTSHAIDVDLDVVSASGAQQFVTVLADTRSNVGEFSGCGMRFDAGASGPNREIFAYREGQFSTQRDWSDPLVVGARYRIQFVIDGRVQLCSTQTGGTSRLLALTLSSRGGFVGLRASNVTVRFRSVAVYRF